MWSVRMRGSVTHGSLTPAAIHITGAEGLYPEDKLKEAVRNYIVRALTHPRGMPDKVVITLERLKEKPKTLKALPVSTLRCNTPEKAKDAVFKMLRADGISKSALKTAWSVLKSKKTMRGASIISKDKGRRLEPDKIRGIRVSRLGIDKRLSRALSLRLSRLSINTDTVKEALMLASKAASWPDTVAEVCISDDPDYTTGYIASKTRGYLRIPNIKPAGSLYGGRVFFVPEDADIENLINYLEKTPVIICRLSKLKGMVELNEILGNPYR